MKNDSTATAGLTKSEIAEFCDRQDSNADSMMDPKLAGGNFQQAIINGTLASGMREVTNALRDLAGIDR